MPGTALSQAKARFASFEFDFRTGGLTRQGMRVRLEIQPAKVLDLLLSAEGELVSRAELIAALWPGQVEGDFDRRLDKAVAKLRASLNDDPVHPAYIETLKGRGYRFRGEFCLNHTKSDDDIVSPPVHTSRSIREALVRNATEPHEASPDARSVPPGSLRRVLTFRNCAVGAALLTVPLLLVQWLHGKASGRRGRPILLILQFRDASKSNEGSWVSHSIAEWLSSDLSAGGDLQVVQAPDSIRFRPGGAASGCPELPPEMLEAAKKIFSADMILYGDYTTTEDGASGKQWRLDACLTNTKDRKTPESMAVIGAEGNIPQLVFDAGDLVRSKLGLKHLSAQSLGYLRAILPANPTAARLYAEGTSALAHFQPEEASVLLAQAAQIEPEHAPTHAALAAAWSALGYQQRGRDEALVVSNLATSLSPLQQLEYEGLADETKNDWSAAVDAYTRLVKLYPDSTDQALKLANAQVNANNAPLALETLRTLRGRNGDALADPRVDLAEAFADSAISDFRGQLAASTRAESRAAAQESDLMVADARMEQGNANDMLDNWDDALRLWRLAGRTYESIGDRGGMADALNHQAILAWRKYDPVTATRLFEQAMSLSKSAGNQGGVANSLSQLGNLKMSAAPGPDRDLPGAIKMFRQAESIYEATGNLAEQANVWSLFGDESVIEAHFEEAKRYYLKAMTLSQTANDKSRVANRLLDLGIVAEFEGQSQDAERYFRQSSMAYKALGQKDRVAIAQERLGKTLFREGRIDQAAAILEDVLVKMKSIGRALQVIEARGDLIAVEMVRNPAKAENLAQENLELSKSLRPAGYVGDPSVLAQLAEIEARQGELREARGSISEISVPMNNASYESFQPQWLRSRGYVRMNSHDFPGANADFERSRNLAHTQKQIYEEMEGRLGLAELHVMKQGNSALPELATLKNDADRLGYGIINVKIEAFVQSLHSGQ